ncbi:MAG: disulfide isomerase DsbC N-terminal domain-containing protein, partial [Steroidobacteraceae bacterium]
MTSKKLLLLMALLSAVAWNPVPAQQPAATADPREELARHIPGARADEFRSTPIAGMWEYTRGGEIAYVSADGRFAISGDL